MRVKRIITLYQSEDDTWTVVDVQMGERQEASDSSPDRVTSESSADDDEVYDFVNRRMFWDEHP